MDAQEDTLWNGTVLGTGVGMEGECMILEAHEDSTVMQSVSMTLEDCLLVFAQEMSSDTLANAILTVDSMGVRLNLTAKSTVMDITAQIVDGLEEIDAWHAAGFWRRQFNELGWL